MFHWRFNDGTTVFSHAQVEGQSGFAEHLRCELVSLIYGCGPLIWLTPEAHVVELDPSSDELLALWLLQEAQAHGLRLLETDFPNAEHRSGKFKGSRRDPVTAS